MEDRENTIVLTDEDGDEYEFTVIDVLDVDDKEYLVLLPPEGEDAEVDEAVILRLEVDENGEEVLYDIEDDEEWDRVSQAWEERMEQEFDEWDEES